MSIKENKLKVLNDYLKEKEHISLYEYLDLKSEEELYKEDKLKDNISNTAKLFFLEEDILLDDSKNIPNISDLAIDEILLNTKKDKYTHQLGEKKNKDVIKRNLKLLDEKNKKKLGINLCLSFLPFLAFVIFSLARVISNSVETLNTYAQGDKLSSSQQAIEDSLDEKSSTIQYVNVDIGNQVESINNISSANSSYNITLVTRFDFDQIEFHKMWWLKEKGEIFNSDNFYTDLDLFADNYCFNSTEDGWLKYSDNIPDILQFNFADNIHPSSDNTIEPISISTLYQEERKAYPGEKSSNVFTDKNDEFSIGNGKISPDSLEYLEKGKAYFDNETNSYRFFQKLHYSATINKQFDSPRYPLDSAQFHVYIQPTRNTNFIRYVPNTSMSGFSTYFNISDGYRLIRERDNIKNFSTKLNYYTETDLDKYSSTYNQTINKSQCEIIVRANKHGFSVFVNSFLNIIAVAIWLILAFFNQSYNKEDSISMIGTGFFSAISAILLGFSLSSSSNIFSLLSLINIFTLGMVLFMGYESISAKRANKLNNPVLIAYRTIKIRILFYFFLICSLLMYIVIPAIAYLWIL